MARRLWSWATIMHLCALVAVCLLLIGARSGTANDNNEFDIQLSKCPLECNCQGLTVDCSQRRLTHIPHIIAQETQRLRLEQNLIAEVPSKAFSPYKQLKRIDLSKNNITQIAADAFAGLKSLNSIFLFSNEISELPEGLFKGLTNLQLLLLNANKITCIRKGTFADLKNLNLLSLYDNKIQSISESVFAPLVSIQTLHLGRNPFICDCNLKWLAEYLQMRPTLETSEARCEEPKRNARKRISQLHPEKFKCKGNEEMRTKFADQCLVDTKVSVSDSTETPCPANCTCTGSVVRCSRQKLKTVPKNLQPFIAELYLDVNDISVIASHVNQLHYLTRLDLSNNQISIIPNNIISNLTNLQTLILSYNKLQCIQPEAFRGLKSLRVLSLHGNDISIIPDGAFKDLTSISHIAIGANPLYCDCSLRWLAEWIQNGFVEGGIARCQEPKSMRDKLIMSASPSHFVCTEEPDPQVLAKCDSCYSFPCANGATCISKPMREYECDCALGFYGQHCEYKIDSCFGNPCENGGTCKVLEIGRFSCHCPLGFDGERCETNIDDCIGHKCENNATCIDQIESYTCHCQPGFGGNYCERKINFCDKENNVCKNGATCADHTIYYKCICPPGWSGDNCTVNGDDCVDHMCQNGGTCVDGINEYRCECPVGFAGKFCELAPIVELYPQTSPCQHHDCKHGVCFLPAGTNDYICKCSPGYTGKRCEMLSSISFRDGSYLEFDPLKVIPSVNISIKFVTKKQNGVLLYIGDSQHLAIELFKGHVRISLDVGNYPISTMFSYETVSDGLYHELEFVLLKKNFTMRVDGGTPRTIINSGSKEYLDAKSSLYLGGLPDDVARTAIKNWHIWNSSSLEGCMREIYMNGMPPDLSTARRQHSVLPGCVEFDDPNRACVNNLCQKGKCVPTGDQNEYECKCRGGWSGSYCDQAPTCQKEMRRDYYFENDCRSTKKLKLAYCVGACGANCCRANKTRKRAIRLACDDGSKFTKEIEIIKKCGCVKKC